MVLYVYSIAYHQKGKIPVPCHWAIFVTDEENGDKGTKYHAVGNPFMGYNREVASYDLASTNRTYTRTLLGCIDEVWGPQLAQIASSIAAPGISRTPLDPFAVSNTCATMYYSKPHSNRLG